MTKTKTAALALAAVFGVTAPGCKDEQAKSGVNVEKVKESPERYYGREVTLTGEVDEVFGLRAFELESNDLFDEQILVASRSDIRLGDSGVVDDQKVRVTGIVRAMVIVDVEREIGWDLDPQIEASFRTRPILIARSVARLDRPELAWKESMAPAPGQTTAEAAKPLTDLGAIAAAESPAEFFGRPVKLERVHVQEMVSDRAFWIGPSAEQRVLVVLDHEPATPKTAIEGRVDVNKDQTINVTGTVRNVPREAAERQRLGLTDKGDAVLKKQNFYLEASRVDIVSRVRAAGG